MMQNHMAHPWSQEQSTSAKTRLPTPPKQPKCRRHLTARLSAVLCMLQLPHGPTSLMQYLPYPIFLITLAVLIGRPSNVSFVIWQALGTTLSLMVGSAMISSAILTQMVLLKLIVMLPQAMPFLSMVEPSTGTHANRSLLPSLQLR